MRRLLCLAALALGLTVSSTMPAGASWTEYVCTQSSPLNMRDANGKVIGNIPKGHYVVVHHVNTSTGFAYVSYGKKSGWVAYWYLCY